MTVGAAGYNPVIRLSIDDCGWMVSHGRWSIDTRQSTAETPMNMPHQSAAHRLWRLPDLFARAGVRADRRAPIPDVQMSSLEDDSRSVARGSCFVAIRGICQDGHKFIKAAAEAGAVAVVVDREVATPAHIAVVRVADAREALSRLAAAYYGLRGDTGRRLPLIGVTGTNGKTTVAWLLRSILQAANCPTALLGTIEYDLIAERQPAELTTPGSLALCQHLATAREAGAVFGVLEVSSHALDQRRCDGLELAAGVFINLSGDHLDYHGSMEAYFGAKRRLFGLLDARSTAVVNLDDPMGKRLAGDLSVPVVSFGLHAPDVDVSAEVQAMTGSGSTVVLRGRSFEVAVSLSLIGRHNVMNALAAAATAKALGVGPGAIRAGLERVKGVPGRLQRVEPVGWPFAVIVDYAHTDAALENVLLALRPLTRDRLICVFGCGGDRDRSKRPRMAVAVGRTADIAYVTSDNPRTEAPRAIIDEILPGFGPRASCRVVVQVDRKTAIEAAIAEARAGDTVLIAGKGHEDYQIVGDKRLHFDDVEVAQACLDRAAVSEEVA